MRLLPLGERWHVIRWRFERVGDGDDAELVEHVTLETHDKLPDELRAAYARARAAA